MFRALLLTKDDEGTVTSTVTDLDDSALPEGDATVAVEYSTVNYKDGLALKNLNGVVRTWPMVPGIDFAGTVVDAPGFAPGARVTLNGWGVGESHWGGFSQRTRVKAGWLTPLPEAISTKRAMAIGTAGFTSMLCVLALEAHGSTPGDGPVIVTGASGGVGSTAVAILATLGYEVHASTGRPSEAEYLKGLGATTIISRDELTGSPRMLGKVRWAAGIDAVGSTTLANVLSMVRDDGCVAACGLAQGMDLPTTVAPFILRGVTLAGVNSVTRTAEQRTVAWERLATDLPFDKLDAMTSTAGLADLPRLAEEILAGQVRGRVVIDVNA